MVEISGDQRRAAVATLCGILTVASVVADWVLIYLEKPFGSLNWVFVCLPVVLMFVLIFQMPSALGKVISLIFAVVLAFLGFVSYRIASDARPTACSGGEPDVIEDQRSPNPTAKFSSPKNNCVAEAGQSVEIAGSARYLGQDTVWLIRESSLDANVGSVMSESPMTQGDGAWNTSDTIGRDEAEGRAKITYIVVTANDQCAEALREAFSNRAKVRLVPAGCTRRDSVAISLK